MNKYVVTVENENVSQENTKSKICSDKISKCGMLVSTILIAVVGAYFTYTQIEIAKKKNYFDTINSIDRSNNKVELTVFALMAEDTPAYRNLLRYYMLNKETDISISSFITLTKMKDAKYWHELFFERINLLENQLQTGYIYENLVNNLTFFYQVIPLLKTNKEIDKKVFNKDLKRLVKLFKAAFTELYKDYLYNIVCINKYNFYYPKPITYIIIDTLAKLKDQLDMEILSNSKNISDIILLNLVLAVGINESRYTKVEINKYYNTSDIFINQKNRDKNAIYLSLISSKWIYHSLGKQDEELQKRIKSLYSELSNGKDLNSSINDCIRGKNYKANSKSININGYQVNIDGIKLFRNENICFGGKYFSLNDWLQLEAFNKQYKKR